MIDKIITEIKVWDNWQNNYKNFVPLFIEEAKTKNNWTEWDNEVFQEFFEKNRDQCVASLQQGYYSHDEKLKIKSNWNELAQMLSKISHQQDFLDLETYDKIRNWLRQFTTQNRKASANRLIASLQPRLLCTIVNEDRIKVLMQRINKNDSSALLTISNNWFENSNKVLNYFKSKFPDKDYMDILTYPWQTYDILNNLNNARNSLPNHNNNDMSETQDAINFLDILQYKKQIILQGPPGTGKTREAKLIAKEILGFNSINDLGNNAQFKLIQFHPSYTYEDFVRGIVAKPNEEGDGILYEAENKTLGNFAKIALDNYLASKQENNKIENKPVFDAFIEFIKEEIAQSDLHKYNITEAVYLFSADETRFKYKGDNWVAHNKGLNMKFSELKKIIDSGAKERQDVKKISELEELTRQHATYFIRLVEKFYEFEKAYELEIPITHQPELNNYVLVIDEINRANLTSVLGELIYALEYRGEVVESMYEVDGSQKLILPPNLYIIGTMNTADRSVGHIDYAIRRRFAFVDVLPEKLSETDEIYFNTMGYEAVEKLFTSDLVSNEFDVKDVQIGHSYFIAKKEEATNELKRDAVFKMKMDYEIKPILREYLKDGIFVDGKQIDGKDIKMYIEDLA